MKLRMLLLGMMILVTAGIFVISCGKSSSGYNSNPGGGTPPPAGHTVSIKNMAFSPASLSVAAGTTVTWTNNDAMTHTVTADDGTTFDSGDMAQGATYSHKFTTSGTVAYHCKIHPGMTASVAVP